MQPLPSLSPGTGDTHGGPAMTRQRSFSPRPSLSPSPYAALSAISNGRRTSGKGCMSFNQLAALLSETHEAELSNLREQVTQLSAENSQLKKERKRNSSVKPKEELDVIDEGVSRALSLSVLPARGGHDRPPIDEDTGGVLSENSSMDGTENTALSPIAVLTEMSTLDSMHTSWYSDKEVDEDAQSTTNGFELSDLFVVLPFAADPNSRASRSVASAEDFRRDDERAEKANAANSTRISMADESAAKALTGAWSKIIAFPGSPYRTTWDMCGGVLIFYDLLAIPLMVFDPPNHPITDFMDWTTLVFWTINMLASVTVGFARDGVTVMDPKAIVLNYLKGIFIIDFLVVFPDWVISIQALVNGPVQEGQAASLLKILRVMRIMRLVRVLRLGFIMAAIKDYIDSEYTTIMFDIGKMVLLLLVINHLVACIWFLTGRISCDSGWPCWVLVHEYDLGHVSWGYQYLTSFHWSITQFTPASKPNLQPQNALERSFAVGLVVFALIGFAYIVGSITGSLTQLRQMSETSSKEFSKLRRFLRRNQVPMQLSLRIRRYIEFEFGNQKQALPMSSVACLKFLSDQLTNELLLAINVPKVSIHPLFDWLSQGRGSTALMMQRASKGFLRKQLARGDAEFSPIDHGQTMYFVVSGKLIYTKMDSSERVQQTDVEPAAAWISEAALWMKEWQHLGLLTATTETALLMLDQKKFSDALKAYPGTHRMVATYIVNFAVWINKQDPDDLSDVMTNVSHGNEIKNFIPEF